MAGRIRTIKPELLEDERIAALSSNAFRLFIGCILLADDYGNLRMASGWLGGQVFWHQLDVKRATPTDIEDAKAELLATGPVDPITQKPKAGLLVPYCVRGQVYAHISGWERHQKIDRPGAPRVPGPSEDTNKINDSECIRDIREPLASHSRLTTIRTKTLTSTSTKKMGLPPPGLTAPVLRRCSRRVRRKRPAQSRPPRRRSSRRSRCRSTRLSRPIPRSHARSR